MESMETPAKRADVSQRQLDDRILVVKCDSTNKVLDSRSDAITPTTTTTKVQPIKIVIPVTGVVTLSGPTTINSPPKMIISPVHLSTQPTVSVKVGTNQLMSVKMVTNASLIQNSLTSSPPAVMNGVSDVANTSQKPVVSPDISAGSPLTNLPLTDDTQAKMTREQKQLQASINSSMVLSQMVTAGSTTRKSRGRKKKSQSPKAPQTDTTTNNIPRSKSMDVLNKGPRTRSRSRSQGQMTEDLNSENDGSTPKRHNMRSANADFAQKQKSFMKEIIKTQDSEEESAAKSDEETHSLKGTATKNVTVHIESLPQAPKKGWTRFCWRCYQSSIPGTELISCSNLKCKRSFHTRCMSKQQQPTDKWTCPECQETEAAETVNSGKPKFEKDFVSILLNFVLNRMLQTKNYNLLTAKTEDASVPNYDEIVVYPMNLDILQSNIKMKKYKSIEAFHSDAKWLLYNCAVLPEKRRYLQNAKSLLKVCRQEILEIETCFECYFKANTEADWFVDVCSSPHILLWAKLRGFPYWPAKSMSVNATTGQVNVRFFGAHDRAWINVKDCYLYSKEDPNGTNPKKQNDIAECIKEVNTHIEKLSETFNGFKHAALRTPYDPNREPEQLKYLLPNIDRYHRTTEISKLVEALLSGHKPKLTLKIIRTSDNTLATSSTETNGEKIHEKDEPGIAKFKIMNCNKKNCQILPVVPGGEAGKFTMKRSADSWMIQDTRVKKQKSVTEESEQDRQKGTLMRSLNLERRDEALQRLSAEVVKEGTPISGDGSSEKGSTSDRKSVNGKRRKSVFVESEKLTTTTPNDDDDRPTQQKRRSQRIKSTSEKNVDPKKTKETEKEADNQTSPPKTSMTEPPPLVPFDSVQIKPDPDSEEAHKNQTSVTLDAPKNRGIPITQKSMPSGQVRIKVKNLSKLTNEQPAQNKTVPSASDTANKQTNVISKVAQPPITITHLNGPKRSQMQQQRPVPRVVTHQNMVYIPATDRNGPETNSHNQSGSSSSTSNDGEPPIHALSGFITPNFASAITDTIVRGPPKLQQSPKETRSALRGESTNVFNSEAGPISRLLNDNAHRFADFFRHVMTDSMSDLAASGSLEAKNRMLEMEIEQLKQKHAKEISELKHNSDLILSEFKKSQEKREAQLIDEISRKCELERIRAVEKAIEETKNKNWCTFCKRDALYHCCSNTWYCGYRCQQRDWSEHMRQCHNGSKQDNAVTDKTRTQHIPGPTINAVPVPQKQQKHLLVQPTNKGPPINATPVVRQQTVMMSNPTHSIGLIQQRTTTGPQIISVRGMVE